MIRSGLVCLLLAALAWGQAASSTSKPVPAAQKPGTATTAAPAAAAPPAQKEPEASSLPPDAPVITIKGLCDNPPADKAAAENCKTVITRAEFEKVLDAVQPTMPARVRRQFASRYANALAMAKKAEQMGLDKGPSFEEHMKLARIQVLSQELNKELQEKASQVSDKEIEDYYHNNLAKFEQAELDRLYLPRSQQPAASDEDETKEAKPAQQSQTAMKEAAEKLRARAVAGESFNTLQAEAYKLSGIKGATPNTSMGKVRRTMLPASQVSVMDLKPGETSSVMDDASGYFVYKLKSKETMTLDQAREEIKGMLRSQHIQEAMRAAQESATPVLDDAYFGPEGPARGPMMPPAAVPAPSKPTPPGPK